MTALTKNTTLIFTEIKNGCNINSASTKVFENTIEGYIYSVSSKECDGRLDVGVEEILSDDGDVIDFTPNKFFELPLETQLEMCIDVNNQNYASSTKWEVK